MSIVRGVIRPVTRDVVRGGIRVFLPRPLFQMPLVSDLSIPIGTAPATFTRATTGTYVDRDDGLVKTAAVDTSRFEQNGVLIEGASTNLLLRSEEFDNATWSKSRVTVSADSIISPDGTLNADKITEDSDTGSHQLFQLPTFTLNVDHNYSVFAKAGERTKIRLHWNATGSTLVVDVDLLTGQILNGSVNATVEDFGNGWWRITKTAQRASANAIVISILDDSGNVSYTGDGTSGLYIWGAQLEQLPFASSYIPTTSTTVTRAADNLSVDAANIPAPTADYSWGATVDRIGFTSATNPGICSVAGESSRDLRVTDSNGNVFANHSAFASGGPIAAGQPALIFATKDASSLTLFLDGAIESSASPGVVTGSASSITIGLRGSSYWFGHIKNLRIYDVALTAEQVGAL